ncbi:MAG: helix-turn-helix transcriptional regulator [Chthoniobacter sp.]|nr:helix-turn-helix transcriptional regulator [Chthoniobacter sp.]
MSHIGDRIRARRQALAWTLDRLAAEAEVSKGFLSELENGNRKSAGSDYLKQIAKALSVPVDHLISGTPLENSDQDVQIPASLAAFAKSENLTFPQTLMILKLRQQVVAFRNEGGADSFDWKPFYEAVKSFLQ